MDVIDIINRWKEGYYKEGYYPISEREKPFDFRKIDTSLAERFSNKQLLDMIEQMPIIERGVSGWGNLAELLKRFEKHGP